MRYLFILLISLISHVRAACECGFAVNRTDSHYFGLFTNSVEADFLHTANTTYEEIGSTGWQPQIYNVTAENARGNYGKSYQLGNIIANPLPEGQWNSHATGAGGPGLQLWVRSGLESGLVPVAEISTGRMDMLYGSFRAGIRMSGINGTCGAFFWYRNDSQEIDIEYLSKDPAKVNQILQSPQSIANGYDASDTINSGTWGSFYQLPDGYHEYRFDWVPDRVDFYLDGMKTMSYTTNVPNSPGHLMLSHWSNGNIGWSGGPPLQDAVMAVSYIKAYFNVSSRDEAAPDCTDLSIPDRVCLVPDQMFGPDPAQGYGKTTFLTLQPKDTEPGTPRALATPLSEASASFATLDWRTFLLAFVFEGLYNIGSRPCSS